MKKFDIMYRLVVAHELEKKHILDDSVMGE